MKVRRVITGLDSSGRSCIALDASLPIVSDTGVPKMIWKSAAVPARNDGPIGAADFNFDFDGIHRGGTAFLIVEIPPGESLAEPGMHVTDTLDYIVILKGRLELVVETGSVILDAGDVVVDRGVLHGSRAIGSESVVMAVILIPAEPVAKGRAGR